MVVIYDYKCECGKAFAVIKSMKQATDPEKSPCCGLLGQRLYSAPQISVKNFDAAYYPALGKVFNNKRDLAYHLDKNNLVEVGNDFGSGDAMQKHFEKARDEKNEKAWAKAWEETGL